MARTLYGSMKSGAPVHAFVLAAGVGGALRATILDMGGVPYVDSAGMSEIISHEIYCRDQNVRLTLAGVTPRVLTMFHITRLESVLTLAPTVEEAEART